MILQRNKASARVELISSIGQTGYHTGQTDHRQELPSPVRPVNRTGQTGLQARGQAARGPASSGMAALRWRGSPPVTGTSPTRPTRRRTHNHG